MDVKAEPVSVGASLTLELLAPHYPDVCDASYRLPVLLTLSPSLELLLEFPGRCVEQDVECINAEEGCPRCRYQAILRGLVLLQQRGDIQLTTEYVVNLERNFALLRLQISVSNAAALEEFELVKTHIQQQQQESGETARARRRRARESSCHVVGCTLHRWKHPRTSAGSTVKQEKQEKLETVPKLEPVTVERAVSRQGQTETIDLTLSSDSEPETRDEGAVPMNVGATLSPEQHEPCPEVLASSVQDEECLDTCADLIDEEVATQKLNLPDVYRSLMARTDTASTDMWGEVVPGLQLKLYEHQRFGLSWMLKREKPVLWSTILWHPFSAPCSVGGGDVVARSSDGELEREFTETSRDACGGMLCDEPGLGKTITMLALILLSRGESTRNMPIRVDLPSGNTSKRQLRSERRESSIRPEQLVGSAASLIVAPDALVEHWAEQIEAHVTPGLLKTFVDEGEDLPSSSELAKYDVVITSFSRMAKEWQHHRPPSTLEARQIQRYGFEDQPARYLDGNVRGEVSSLLLVHWLRVVVDEGHKLGGRAPTNLMQMSRQLCAERRWVMTGTPSPNTLQSADLQYLHGLLVFLRNQPYGRPDGSAWTRAIAAPFEKNEIVAFHRLRHLLKRIMIRHTKDSISNKLPKPIRRTVVIAPTPSEFKLYNGIAESVRANLVVADIDPDTPGNNHPDSLLNPKNRKAATKVETNLTFASTGGFYGEWSLEKEGREYSLKRLDGLKVSEAKMASITKYLDTVRPHKTTACGDCGVQRKTLLVLPCGHLCCAYCVDDNKEEDGEPRCFRCHQWYNEDEMDYLQPTRTGELTPRGRKNTVDKLRMNGVGGTKLELVNAYLDKLEPNPPTKCQNCSRELFLLMILPCGHLCCADCVGSRFYKAGPSCCHCYAGYDRTDLVLLQPGIFFAAPKEDSAGRKKKKKPNKTKKKRKRSAVRSLNVKRDIWQVDSSKIFYMAARIRELKKEFARATSRRVLKAIIFSQFRESIWRSKIALEQLDIPTANFISLVSSRDRIEFLDEFRTNPNVNVLLLSNMGSHGLDLSFVTHIFLLEEIWDKSVEQQVVSRAHRMGASHSVVVEQLWMRGSVECQQMSGMAQQELTNVAEEETTQLQHQLTRSEVQEASSADKSSFQQMRLNYVLNNLRILGKDVAAKDGEVRFCVLNEEGVTVRQGVHTISDSGDVVTTSSGSNVFAVPVVSVPAASPEDEPVQLPRSGTRVVVVEDSSSASEAGDADNEDDGDYEYEYNSDASNSDEEEKAAVPEIEVQEVKVESAATSYDVQQRNRVYIEISDDDETESDFT